MPLAELPESRVLAFLDILGFRRLVAGMSEDASLYSVVSQVMRDLDKRTREYDRSHADSGSAPDDARDPLWLEEFEDFAQAQFSDSIVLSQALSRGGSANRVAFMVRNLAAQLLRRGIFTRGGLAVGWCHHQGNVLFGDAMISAYELESLVARVPRIVVQDRVVDLLHGWERQSLLQDTDGFFFLNVFDCLRGSDDEAYPDSSQYMAVRAHIARELLSAASDQARSNHLSMYRWMARQFNSQVLALQKLASQPGGGFAQMLDVPLIEEPGADQ